ncbi:transglutaminase-like cysteine peptidase [Uliginosibacterium sp. H1]|uniref:transglutaminase-like cysteine peptidase n=1 Tax=Uliginosibacterium sp. H1 TaxID=3114757 RepID=UPI002E182B7A|nr:transglutaminase-like cysteine peptidase [Uliginosibacterium sp. H1]
MNPPRILMTLGLAMWAWGAQAYLAEASQRLVQAMSQRFGPAAGERVLAWQRAARNLPAATDPALIERSNALANRVPYAEDINAWHVDEHWATPAEFVARNAGDCEDYTIAKYFSLRERGVAADKLRIVYVRAKLRDRIDNHMVLAYYPQPEADPLVLDNLDPRLLPASQRQDLSPVFSFNDEHLWRDGQATAGGASQVRRWRELQERVRREQSL